MDETRWKVHHEKNDAISKMALHALRRERVRLEKVIKSERDDETESMLLWSHVVKRIQSIEASIPGWMCKACQCKMGGQENFRTL